jgi:hypothetical protein
VGGNGIAGECDHWIAYREAGDTGAQGAHDPRDFAAQSTRVTRIHAERIEHIAEVEPGGADFDLYLAAAGRPTAFGRQPQIVEVAPGLDTNDLPLCNLRLECPCERLQARGEGRTVTDGNLNLGASEAGDKVSRLRGVDRRPRIEIEPETGRFGPLGGQRAGKTDHCQLGRIARFARFDGMRTPRQQAQARPWRDLCG